MYYAIKKGTKIGITRFKFQNYFLKKLILFALKVKSFAGSGDKGFKCKFNYVDAVYLGICRY